MKFTHAIKVSSPGPRIINWSYYPNPDTLWLIDDSRFALASSQPLNGTVISVDTDSGGNFTESMWSGIALNVSDVDEVLARFQARNVRGWGALTSNFIAVNTETFAIDWFDPAITTVVSNLSLAGWFASQAGVGLWFDAEGYSQEPWQYSTMPGAGSHTFAEYETQVYTLARLIARNWMTYNPRFLFASYKGYYEWYQYLENNGDTQSNREANPYGLFKSFLDGIYDEFGTTGLPKVIKAGNRGWNCSDLSCFTFEYARVTGYGNVNYQGPAPYYFNDTLFGSALYLTGDNNGAHAPFNPATPGDNYMTPDLMKSTLLMQQTFSSVRYQWVYTENITFYEPPAGWGLIPDAYLTKLREIVR